MLQNYEFPEGSFWSNQRTIWQSSHKHTLTNKKGNCMKHKKGKSDTHHTIKNKKG